MNGNDKGSPPAIQRGRYDFRAALIARQEDATDSIALPLIRSATEIAATLSGQVILHRH
jgi:hypothetical protein